MKFLIPLLLFINTGILAFGNTCIPVNNEPNKALVINLSVAQTNLLCFGVCTGEINLTATGGSSPYQYSIDNGSTFSGNSIFSNLCSGIYSVIVTDALGAQTSTIVTLNEPTILQGTLSAIDETCYGACDGIASITIPNGSGTAPYSYQWTGVVPGNTPFVQNLCPGTSVVTVTDGNGCNYTDSVQINGFQPLIINPLYDTMICVGGTVTLTTQASGGTGNYAYTWDNGGNSSTITVSPVTTQNYCVVATDGNGCTSSQNCASVSLYQPLQINAFSDQAICAGNSANISATAQGGIGAPYTYTWDQGLGTGQNQTVSPTQTTIYSVSVEDQCETPSVSTSVTITVNPLPSAGFSTPFNNGCAPITVSFLAGPAPAGTTCFWDFGNGNFSTDCNPVFTFTEDGCWDISLTRNTPQGCIAVYTAVNYVCVYPLAQVDFTYSGFPTTTFANSTSISSGFISAWNWDFGDGGTSTQENPTHSFPPFGLYNTCLTATTNAGCINSICKTVPFEIVNTNENSISNISIYPNPITHGNMTIDNPGNKFLSIEISNIVGQVAWKGSINNTQTIDISNLQKGNYIIRIFSDTGRSTQKFVIR